MRRLKPLPANPKRTGAGEYYAFHDEMGYRTIDCRSLKTAPRTSGSRVSQRVHSQSWKAFGVKGAEASLRGPPTGESSEPSPHPISGVNAIFGASPIEGTTTKKRAIYVKARRSNYRMVLTSPP